MTLRVAMVAGETSGDALGAALIAALRERSGPIEFLGVAGPRMLAAGCVPLADADELAVMGLIEPLKHLPRLLRLRSMLIERISAWKPDVFIGIDSPAFNLGLAGKFRSRGIATVQYVSPQVWAWRPGRVRKIARRCDLVLCLLPFEPEFYRTHAVRAEFVGHPLADQIPLLPDRAAARAALAVDAQLPVVALLPGSRVGELRQLAAPFIAAAIELSRRRPGLLLLAPMANGAVRAEFERALAAAPQAARLNLRLLDGQARGVLTAADAALVASGTATLEALLCRCPMVVAYRVGAVTALLLRTLRLIRLPYFSLPNLLAGESLVPEFAQEAVTSDNLSAALERALDDVVRREYLQREFLQVHESLRAGGAASAAQAVLRLLRDKGLEAEGLRH
ncbi:MAG TPA: lipid-A-disaccharide synthase [Steroidobacteraceae bacterium]|nr:lipid-A-disaccharide synthase [Steroidobacteraceae bacterium]